MCSAMPPEKSGGGYLLGTFGIPLFFVVNGYLLCNKNFTLQYVSKKVFGLIRFISLWVLCIGVLQMIVSQDVRKILECFIGTFLGNGRLFHLWFLWGLGILWVITYIMQKTTKSDKASDFIRKWTVVLLVILMTGVFILNCVLYGQSGKEIREIIPPIFRLITNDGYFLTGMAIGKYREEFDEKVTHRIAPIILITTVLICWMVLILLANISGMVYASSYYDFMLVWLACVAIFALMKLASDGKKSKNFVVLNLMRESTTGIYIFHPFMISGLNKFFSYIGIDTNVLVKWSELIVIIAVCTIITVIMKKTKLTKVFVEI